MTTPKKKRLSRLEVLMEKYRSVDPLKMCLTLEIIPNYGRRRLRNPMPIPDSHKGLVAMETLKKIMDNSGGHCMEITHDDLDSYVSLSRIVLGEDKIKQLLSKKLFLTPPSKFISTLGKIPKEMKTVEAKRDPPSKCLKDLLLEKGKLLEEKISNPKERIEFIEKFFVMSRNNRHIINLLEKSYQKSSKVVWKEFREIIISLGFGYFNIGSSLIDLLDINIPDSEFYRVVFSQCRFTRTQQLITISILAKICSDEDISYIKTHSKLERRLGWILKANHFRSIVKKNPKSYSSIQSLLQNLKKFEKVKNYKKFYEVIEKGKSSEEVIKTTSKVGYDFFLSRLNNLLRYSQKTGNYDFFRILDLISVKTDRKRDLEEYGTYLLSSLFRANRFFTYYPTSKEDYEFLEKYEQVPFHTKGTKYLEYTEETKEIISQLRFELGICIKRLYGRIHDGWKKTDYHLSEYISPSIIQVDYSKEFKLEFIPQLNLNDYHSLAIERALRDIGVLDLSNHVSNVWIGQDWVVGISEKKQVLRYLTSVVGDKNLRDMLGSRVYNRKDPIYIYSVKEGKFYFILPHSSKIIRTGCGGKIPVPEGTLYIFKKLQNPSPTLKDFLELIGEESEDIPTRKYLNWINYKRQFPI